VTLVAAFDPGVTTGVAWLKDGVFGAEQFDEHSLYEWVDSQCELFDHIQIEQFIINAATIRKVRVYDSLYLIGYLRYAAWRCGFPTAFTKPSDVMKPFDDAALKRAGMHTPGKEHANDAARHLAHRLVKTRALSGSIFLPK
jgi:hypothetical protein